jgi:redox-regulated HSP33 family molecular chaperone
MKCRKCNKELFKNGLRTGKSICVGERLNIKWENGNQYIECKYCKAKYSIESRGKNKIDIKPF